MTDEKTEWFERRIEEINKKPYALRVLWLPAWMFDHELEIGERDPRLPGMEVIWRQYSYPPWWKFWQKPKAYAYKFREIGGSQK